MARKSRLTSELKRLITDMVAIIQAHTNTVEMVVDGRFCIGVDRENGDTQVTSYCYCPGRVVTFEKAVTAVHVPSQADIQDEDVYRVPLTVTGLRKAFRIAKIRAQRAGEAVV